MQRTIIMPPAPGAESTAPPDDYLGRLVKYVPAEVIAAFLAIDGVAKSLTGDTVQFAISSVAYVVLAVGTYPHLRYVAGVIKARQIMISVLAFLVWGFAIGGPFVFFDWWQPAFGAILVALVTFGIPIFENLPGD